VTLADQIRKLKSLPGSDAEKRVIQAVHEKIKERIFVKGLDGLNRQIGSYSDSYNRLRARLGKSTGRVILKFTGQMADNFQLVKRAYGYTSWFDDDEAQQKATWNIKRYGEDIFELTDDEEKFINDELEKEIERML